MKKPIPRHFGALTVYMFGCDEGHIVLESHNVFNRVRLVVETTDFKRLARYMERAAAWKKSQKKAKKK